MLRQRLVFVCGPAAILVASFGCAPNETAPASSGTSAAKPPSAKVGGAEPTPSPVELTEPNGWTRSTSGPWTRWVSADKHAELALSPLEGTVAEKTRELEGVFGVTEIRLASPQPLLIGPSQMKSQGSDGAARFASGDGVIACASVEAGGPKPVVIAYAFDKDATAEARQEAMAAVGSLRPRR